jgi:hypothetical protein
MIIANGQQFAFASDGTVQETFREHQTGEGSVISATAVIEGIDVEFANRNDHHLGRLRVFLTTEVLPTVQGLNDRIRVFVNFGLRDWSGGSGADDLNGDDPIRGTIQYSLIINTR